MTSSVEAVSGRATLPVSALQRCIALLNRQGVMPVLIFGGALVPRMFDLASRPFWLDEVFTLQRARLAPAALVHDAFLHHHMPSFFLMLSVLLPLGDPQYWLRVPSAVFGSLSVVLVYLIARRVAGASAGVIAALILGLSPAALAFSQEARSYTMEMCLILVALFGVTLLALDIPAASLRLQDKLSLRWAWLTFVLGTAAALDVLGDGLPFLITANLIFVVMLLELPKRRPQRAALMRNILLADLVIAVLSGPFYVMMAMTVTNGFVHSFFWIPRLSLPRLWYNLGSIYLMRVADSVTFQLMNVPTPAALMWLIDAGLVGCAGFGAWQLRNRPGPLAALGFSFLFLPVALIVISIWHPLLLPRYILWSAAPFAILAGIGASIALNGLRRPARVIAYAAITILLSINLWPYYGSETKPRWDIAAQMLARDVAPGDFVYLSDRSASAVLRMYLPANRQTFLLRNTTGNLQRAELAQLQGERVWAVYGHASQSASGKQWPQFMVKIAPLGTPAATEMAGSRIYITLFNAPSHDVAANCVPPYSGKNFFFAKKKQKTLVN